jgi:hypothetical protein
MLCYKDSCSSAPEAHVISQPVHELLKELFLENDPQEHCCATMTDLEPRLAQPASPDVCVPVHVPIAAYHLQCLTGARHLNLDCFMHARSTAVGASKLCVLTAKSTIMTRAHPKCRQRKGYQICCEDP